MNYEEALLNRLLDRYEDSTGFRERREQRQKIVLRLYDDGKCDFPLYDIEDSIARSHINGVVEQLAAQKVISFAWMKGQEGHLIARVTLMIDHLEEAYQKANRYPLADAVDALGHTFSREMERATHEWLKAYWQDQLTFLQSHRHPNKRTYPEQDSEQQEWIKVLTAADEVRTEPLLERVFSLRCLGNTKRFEKIYRTRLLGVLRKYLPMDTDEMTEEELFRQIYLEKYPENFQLCGDLVLQKEDGASCSLGFFSHGAILDARELHNASFELSTSVHTILWIENKANYYEYVAKYRKPDEIVVFHGGCYSPARGAFFQKLCRAAGSGIRLLHWGDIDLGGFQMHSRLRREIDPRFTMFRMGVDELKNNQTSSFGPDYAKKLTVLLQDPELRDAYSCIEYMLEHKLRQEHEALL